MKKELLTVKRRFDWVTACGLVLFVVIVVLELTVAIGVPLLVRKEGVFAEDIMRTQLKTDFDGMRRHINNVAAQASNENVKSEVALLSTNANNLADYLRTHANQLNSAELLEIIDRVKRINAIVSYGAKGTPMTEKITLDTSKFITGLANAPRE